MRLVLILAQSPPTAAQKGDSAAKYVLDAYLFNNLKQVRAISEEWVGDYNAYHPHHFKATVPLAIAKLLKVENSALLKLRRSLPHATVVLMIIAPI